MKLRRSGEVAALAFLFFVGALSAQDKAGLTVIDGRGKEVVLKSWRFVAGTMPADWLADAPKKAAAEYLAFREEKSTTYQNGILTLVPLRSIRAVDYDSAKKTVAVTALAAQDKEAILKGTTKYKDINKLVLEAEADLGALGVAAVKYHDALPILPVRVMNMGCL